ncbi:hypothetical protein MYX06_04185, partial [Patescibacteria group bacterium AH-259-L05]|nr:hypothetical protein [Patescibacteria group bacterium AH-259-L05]
DSVKTIYFLTFLHGSEHTITLLADDPPNTAAFEGVEIYAINDLKKKFTIRPHVQAKDINIRPWLVFVLDNLPLRSVKARITYSKRKRDSDDVKVRIDGKIQTEPTSRIKHVYWKISGSRLTWEIPTKTKTIRFWPWLPQGLHYIEFDADRAPILHKIVINFGKKPPVPSPPIPSPPIPEQIPTQRVTPYTYKGVSGDEDYNQYDKIIEKIVKEWNDEFSNDIYPPPQLLDPNLVKAIIYRESRIGYYPGGEIDIMQVGDPLNPAMRTLNGELKESWIQNGQKIRLDYKGGARVDTPKQSIKWGIRWLYHKAQGITSDSKKYWRGWEQAVIKYNGSSRKYDYQKEVWRIYKDGIDPDGNILWQNKQSSFSIVKIVLFIFLALFILSVGYYWGNKVYIVDQNSEEQDAWIASYEDHQYINKIFLTDLEKFRERGGYYEDYFKNTFRKCEELNCLEKTIFYENYEKLVNNMQDSQHFINAVSSLRVTDATPMDEFYTSDIDNDGENEIIFSLYDPLNRDHVSLAIIDKIDNKYQIIKEKKDHGHTSRISIMDLTGDLKPEIAFFVLFGMGGYKLLIYEYQDDKKLKEIFNNRDNNIYYSEYTFSDTDNDGNMEIKIDGEIRYTKEHGQRAQEIYEYNPAQNTFVLQ